MSARICAKIRSLLQCPIFSKSKMSAKVCMKKKTKSDVYVPKKIAPADMEKCPQKSAGFDKGTDVCGFVADICQLTQKFTQMYAEVSICPQHMPDLLWTLKVRAELASDEDN